MHPTSSMRPKECVQESSPTETRPTEFYPELNPTSCPNLLREFGLALNPSASSTKESGQEWRPSDSRKMWKGCDLGWRPICCPPQQGSLQLLVFSRGYYLRNDKRNVLGLHFF